MTQTPQPPAGPSSGSTGAEIDEGLLIAERLLEAIDRRRTGVSVLRLLQALCVLLTAVGVVLVASDASSTGRAVIEALAVTVVGVIGILTINAMGIRPLRRCTHRDGSTMLEIVDGIRDLMPIVAETEAWSPTKIRLLRARLARFPIGRGALE